MKSQDTVNIANGYCNHANRVVTLEADADTAAINQEKESSDAEPLAKASDKTAIAPDGGWGWMIVVAAFMVNFIVDGVIGCFGLIYPDLMKQFSSSPALTSMAGSLIVGMYMCSSLLVGGLIRRYGCRIVSITGGCIGAVGCSLSMFSQNLATFMIMYGIIGGIGFGMNSLPGHVSINTCFTKKRGLANGIALSGAGVGVFLMAPLIQFTLTEFGWRGTMLINGGIVLNFCVCGALMRPLNSAAHSAENQTEDNSLKTLNSSKHNEDQENRDVNAETKFTCVDYLQVPSVETPLISKGNTSLKADGFQNANGFLTPDMQRKTNGLNSLKQNNDANSLPDLKNLHLANTDHSNIRHRKTGLRPPNDPFKRKDIFYSGNLYHLSMEEFMGSVTVCDKSKEDCSDLDANSARTCSKEVKLFLRHMCDLTVFRNRFFLPVLIGAIGIQMSQFIPNTFIAAYCYTVDLQDSEISVIVSLFGAFNILGRVSAGCLANLSFINTLWLFNFGVFMCGVACAVFPLCTTFPSISIFSAGLGYFMGYFPPLQILVLVEYIGIEKLTASLGFVQMAKGFSAVAGPPLAGMVYEWTNSYGMAVQFAGVLSFVAAIAQSLVPILDKCSNRTNRRQLETEIQSPDTENMLTDAV